MSPEGREKVAPGIQGDMHCPLAQGKQGVFEGSLEEQGMYTGHRLKGRRLKYYIFDHQWLFCALEKLRSSSLKHKPEPSGVFSSVPFSSQQQNTD